MSKYLIFSFFAAVALFPNQEYPELSPQIENVVSGGYWKTESQDGRYRIIVVNSGWEHVTSQVFIEWLATIPEQRKVDAIKSVPVKELNNGFLSVGRPEMLEIGVNPIVGFTAVNSYSNETIELNIKLGLPGSYQVVE